MGLNVPLAVTNKNKIEDMKFARILSFSVAACILAGCSGDEVLPGGGDGGAEITVALQSSGEPSTRVSLAGSDNLQHVKYVQLYVFNGTDAQTARCVASENVMWREQEGEMAAQYYKLLADIPEGDYTFLAVGLDNPLTADRLPDKSKTGAATAYNLPEAIVAGNGAATGTLLADAYASLAEDKGAADIANAELMAGFSTAHWNATDDITVTVEMKRRVAGVMFYVTNVPEGVDKIELLCSSAQYSNVPLCQQETADYGNAQLGDETKTLLSAEVTYDVLASESVTLADGSVTEKQRGSVYAAAYVLPMPQLTGTFTLRLTYAGGTTTDRKVKIEDTAAAGTYVYDFPVQANWIYTIGSKSATADEPYDLGGTGDIIVDGNWQADVDIPM